MTKMTPDAAVSTMVSEAMVIPVPRAAPEAESDGVIIQLETETAEPATHSAHHRSASCVLSMDFHASSMGTSRNGTWKIFSCSF